MSQRHVMMQWDNVNTFFKKRVQSKHVTCHQKGKERAAGITEQTNLKRGNSH